MSGDAAAVARASRPAAVRAANEALASLGAAYRDRYGAALFEVRGVATAEGLRLRGRVLLAAQRRAAVECVRAAVAVPVEADIEVAVESDAHSGWVVPAAGVVDVWSAPRPESAGGSRGAQPIAPRAAQLATQLVAGDLPARRLAATETGWLVELADGTLGWVAPETVRPAPPETQPAAVRAWRAAWEGEPRAAGAAEWQAAFAPWLGAPYRWGGTSPAGIDCSGLVQRVVKAATGRGLPKHSRDQVRSGQRLATGSPGRAGDLLYLSHRQTGVRHVALRLADDDDRVGHASVSAGVTIEREPELAARYERRACVRFEVPNG
jgi:cell wall-associated NlpC family hydrolase